MTQLVHDCVLLGIAVDPGRLYYADDPDFELWLSTLADKVNASKRAQEKEAGKGR